MSRATVARGSPCCQRSHIFQSASTDVDPQTPDEFGLVPREPASEPGLVPAPIVQVKNTFIHLEDEDSTPPRVRPRYKTFDCRVLSCVDDDAGVETDSNGVEDESPEELACSTPTPHASVDLGFAICQDIPVPQAHVPVLLPVFWPLAGVCPASQQGCGSASLQGGGHGDRPAAAGRHAAGWRRWALSCPQEQLQASLSSTADGFARIQWTVDARKLRGTDKQLVSSTFDGDLGLGVGPLVLRVMLATLGGTASFRKTGGVGSVQVKCTSEGCACLRASQMRLRVSIGRGERQSPPRGPFVHSFLDSTVFTLPRQQAEWDLWAAVDEQSMTLVVNVDIAPMDEAPPHGHEGLRQDDHDGQTAQWGSAGSQNEDEAIFMVAEL